MDVALNLARALEAGAWGYVLKDNPDGIIEGIERVLEGKIYICKRLIA